MRLSLLSLAAVCAFGVAASVAHAASLTYTETVNASGSLNNVAFTNQLLTLSVAADPSTVTGSNGGIFITPFLTLTGTVANTGSFAISGIQVFSNEANNIGGITDGTLGDILDTGNAAFATYNLKSLFGPVSGPTLSSLQTYTTTTGTFRLTSIGANATFQTVNTPAAPVSAVTPEPSSFALLGSGLLGVVGVLRRRLF